VAEPITVEEALARLDTFQELLADATWGPWRVHTFLVGKNGKAYGADWDLDSVRAEMAKHPPRLAGPRATAQGHGIVLIQGRCRSLFIATKKDPQ
jgi:hypothetical protein